MNIDKVISSITKNPRSTTEIINKYCGKLIGRGTYRDVYVLKQNKNYVVKIERDMSTSDFENVLEFMVWKRCSKNFEKWLAKPEMINVRGDVLIQLRGKIKSNKNYPNKIPAIFTDTKIENFGWIGKRFVCFDYSRLNFIVPLKKKKANWWNANIL